MAPLEDYVRNYKNLSVKLSDGSTIRGKANIGAQFKRLSDLMKHTSDKFITIVSENTAEKSRKVFLVNKDHVVWAEAED
jgi:hypothetical protein